MRRLFAFIMVFLLASSLGLGSIAHADEGAATVEISSEMATALGHYDGDRDEVPSDFGKGYPHHHGSCHGDHVGVPVAACSATYGAVRGPAALFPTQLGHSGLDSDPALRPPKA